MGVGALAGFILLGCDRPVLEARVTALENASAHRLANEEREVNERIAAGKERCTFDNQWPACSLPNTVCSGPGICEHPREVWDMNQQRLLYCCPAIP